MIGVTLTLSDDTLRFGRLDRYFITFVAIWSPTHHRCLFAIDSVSVSLDLDVSLSGDDVGLNDGLVVGY